MTPIPFGGFNGQLDPNESPYRKCNDCGRIKYLYAGKCADCTLIYRRELDKKFEEEMNKKRKDSGNHKTTDLENEF